MNQSICLIHPHLCWFNTHFSIKPCQGVWGLHNKGPHSFNIRVLIKSWPWVLLESRLYIVLVCIYCVYLKLKTLCSCLCSSSSWFSVSRTWDFGEFRFFQGIHVRTDIRIDIFVSIRPMTTKFRKHLRLQDLTKARQINQVLVTSWLQDHVAN